PRPGAPSRRLRARRGRASPGEPPRHPARGRPPPSGGLHGERAADVGADVRAVLRLVGGVAPARGDALSRRAGGQAARLPPAGAAGAARVTAAEKYVAAAYLVVFATVLAYVLIISLKLVRLEREVAELTELARARRVREAAPVG